jgi:hypothetical protein
MWVPMLVSNDERRYSWIDEGFTTFHENTARMDFFPGANHYLPDQDIYLDLARADGEGEMLRRSAFHYTGEAFGVASYQKPATVLVALRGVLGDETFERARREFLRRWAWKHPYPWDLFVTFEDVSGRDLDWFWRAWYYETWTLDHALAAVEPAADGSAVITIANRGRAPMPVRLVITRANGDVIRRTLPVDPWLAGDTQTTTRIDAGPPVTRVEIDPDRVFPDIDRTNNTWTRTP